MAKLIDGKQIARDVLDEVVAELKQIHVTDAEFAPLLAIVQVGDRSDSNVYVRMKLALAAYVGVNVLHIKLVRSTTQKQLEAKIRELNADTNTDGIIVQLPLDSTHPIDSDHIIDLIDHDKDVDGLTRANARSAACRDMKDGLQATFKETIIPSTMHGCLFLVQKATGDPHYVHDKITIVVGRSKMGGSPTAARYNWKQGTTTVCSSKDGHLRDHVRQADILIAAVGQDRFISGDWIKPGAVVIDCGFNVHITPDGKRKLYGDVDHEQAKKVASHITPTIGGVGPPTMAMQVRSTFEQAVKRRFNPSRSTVVN